MKSMIDLSKEPLSPSINFAVLPLFVLNTSKYSPQIYSVFQDTYMSMDNGYDGSDSQMV